MKKISTLAGIIIILIFAVLIFGGVFWYENFAEKIQPKIIPTQKKTAGCVPEGGNYYAPRTAADLCCAGLVEQPTTQSGTVGICVKPTTGSDWTKYTQDQLMAMANPDWENQAMFFKGLEGNFLIIDEGTGPDPRGLSIYDLSTKKQVFSDRYSRPLDITGADVEYWNPTSQKVTAENCPDSAKWASEGLGAEIEAHVSLDFKTFTKKDLGQTRCQPTQ